jgi:hypothetical protein
MMRILEISKPALIFVGGAWFVLYLLNRRSATSPMHNRILWGLLAMGLLATADAAIEFTYLVIPKKEKFLTAGCCTEVFDSQGQSSKFLPRSLFKEGHRQILFGAFYGINFGLILALWFSARWWQVHAHPLGLVPMLVASVLAVIISAVFLVEIAAPTLLHQPYHHCPYDLVSQVPESVLTVALFLWATFCIGWASVAAWLGRCPETRAYLPDMVNQIQMLACWCYLASLVMISLELALA